MYELLFLFVFVINSTNLFIMLCRHPLPLRLHPRIHRLHQHCIGNPHRPSLERPLEESSLKSIVYLEIEHHIDKFDVLSRGKDPIQAHKRLRVHLLHTLATFVEVLRLPTHLFQKFYKWPLEGPLFNGMYEATDGLSLSLVMHLPSSFPSSILQYSL